MIVSRSGGSARGHRWLPGRRLHLASMSARTRHCRPSSASTDNGTASPPAARSNGRDLVVSAAAVASVDDSFALTYSRAAEPARRLSVRDLERPAVEPAGPVAGRPPRRAPHVRIGRAGRARRRRRPAAQSPVNDFFHDAASSPGTARVEVAAELIDRGTRKLIARQTFTATAPVAQANCARCGGGTEHRQHAACSTNWPSGSRRRLHRRRWPATR